MDESRRRRCAVEIKLLSSKDLKAFNFFQKLSVYALVSLQGGKDPDNKKSPELNRTPTDGEGDGNPEWNHEMRFEFELKDCDGLFIHFDLRHEGLGLLGIGDRSIGEVHVPLKDLIISLDNNKFMEDDDDHHPEQQQQQHKARYVNYQVTTSDEKANGILNFSYKLIKLNNIKEGISGGDDRPRIQYPTVTLEDDDISSKFNFNTTQVCCPAAISQSQTSLMELQQTPHTSTTTSASSQLLQQEFSVASSAVPPHRVSSQSPSLADHQIPICCWSPQYHQDHDDDDDIHLKYHYPPPPPPPPPSVHAYYPSPPPPPPPPPPMSVRGESYYPPPPGHGMFRPCPPHPNHDYGPWSPAYNNGPRHPHEHGHTFF